jgi:putative ABC transport system permease protein
MRRLLLRSWLWKPQIDAEVHGELAFHLEMRTREYLAQGLSPEEARRAALARFGDVARADALCRDLGARRDRTMNRRQYLSELRQDLTFAARQLAKHPGFAIVTTLTLALGIGGTAAIFSVVNAVVLQPLPVREPQQLVRVWETFRQWHTFATAGNLEAWRTRSTVFEAIAGRETTGFNLADDGGVERVISARVTPDYFRVFGVEPLLGRTLGPADDDPGKAQVAVISEQLWRRRFGADAAVLAREARLNGRPYRIVGVMPAAFRIDPQGEELWVPTAFTPRERASFGRRFLVVFGRLKPGVTRAQAQAEMGIVAARLKQEQPNENGDHNAIVNSFVDDVVGDARQRLLVLLGAVGFVLLIGCANVANLLLARGTTRAAELAVRAALGAGRGRVIRQLLTENALLAGLGAAVGLALAVVAVRALVLFAPHDVPRLDQAHLDPLTLAVTAGIAIASSLLFGLVPVRRAMSQDAGDVLKGGRSGDLGVARDRVRQALVIAEVALALVLLAGSGLLIRTALALRHVDLGFDPERVLSARVSLPVDGYEDPLKVRQTFERMADEARRVPGVLAADVVTRGPLGGGGNWIPLHPEDRPFTTKEAVNAQLRVITPGYLQTMRIAVTRGRAFTAGDREGAPRVVVLSETLAHQLWPGVDPIGKRVDCCSTGETPEWMTIVGVVSDVRGAGPAVQSDPEYYLPLQQAPVAVWTWNQRTMFLMARAAHDPAALTASLREAVTRIDPGLPLFDVQPMDQRLSASLSTGRFVTGLLTTLGVVGLLLAAIGIYGVMAYSVSRRTQEIGLRLALGAAPRDVLLLVARQAITPVLIGVAAGFVLAFLAARLLEQQLVGVTSHDPTTFLIVTLLLIAVAIVASVIPARRAAQVDPTRALGAS